MSDRKKKFISYKEANKRPVAISKHAEYIPDCDAKIKDSSRKEKCSFANEKDTNNITCLSKQPTILIKAREDTQRSVSPKRPLNRENEPGITPKISISNDNTSNLSSTKMNMPVKLIDANLEFNIQALECLMENQNDFLVIGILGSQGVGKSTLLNLIANSNSNDLVRRILNIPTDVNIGTNRKTATSCESKNSSDIFSESSDVTSSFFDKNLSQQNDILLEKCEEFLCNEHVQTHLNNDSNRINMHFAVGTNQRIKLGLHETDGVDMYITSNRMILLDTQPLLSSSIMDKYISDSKNMTQDIAVEIESLYIASFILSSCHIVIMVQDWFTDSNILRLLNTAKMLATTANLHSTNLQQNNEDFLHEQYRSHILLLHNKTRMSDLSHDMKKHYENFYNLMFNEFSNFKICGGLNNRRNMNSFGKKSDKPTLENKIDMNLFIFPEITLNYSNELTYKGHDNLDLLVKRLRQIILAAPRRQIAASISSEKHWGHNAHKNWESIKKSSLLIEYCRILH